ncbi:hypothetical protein GUJ93_ZPchr0013g36611 [Zizania palustris]|uniref:Uncharacterized protein n=1 Tax=Zizania palustris TaxID=103762 RepID=A0A8J5X2P5_ZIZPA|nr:hypothetical protein GUJ93_ZPchr0013g36611 [Zizania palustris]
MSMRDLVEEYVTLGIRPLANKWTEGLFVDYASDELRGLAPNLVDAASDEESTEVAIDVEGSNISGEESSEGSSEDSSLRSENEGETKGGEVHVPTSASTSNQTTIPTGAPIPVGGDGAFDAGQSSEAIVNRRQAEEAIETLKVEAMKAHEVAVKTGSEAEQFCKANEVLANDNAKLRVAKRFLEKEVS